MSHNKNNIPEMCDLGVKKARALEAVRTLMRYGVGGSLLTVVKTVTAGLSYHL